MLSFGLLIPKALLDAWAFWLLWRWFVLPLGAPALGYWQAMGLDTFIGLFLLAGVSKVEEDKEARDNLMVGKMIATPLMVGFAWVILQIWHAS